MQFGDTADSLHRAPNLRYVRARRREKVCAKKQNFHGKPYGFMAAKERKGHKTQDSASRPSHFNRNRACHAEV
jgi:acetylornithine/succinyldiaminopimelate/putrescine aminotransferase